MGRNTFKKCIEHLRNVELMHEYISGPFKLD